MNRIKNIFLIFVFFVISSPTTATHFWFGKTIGATDAEKRWGNREFVLEEFKSGGVSIRGKMTASLIRNKKNWIGKSRSEIRAFFGPHDGFYFTDTIPAYIVDGGEDNSKETWQVVFLSDKNYKVEDLIIHKNCCN